MRLIHGFVGVVMILITMGGSATWISAGEQRSKEEISAHRQKSFQGKMDTALKNIWWNQADTIKHLSLSQSQRSAMDAVFLKHRQNGRETSLARHEVRVAYITALESSNWKEAKVLAQRMAVLTGNMDETRLLERTNVLELLNPKQIETIKEKYPLLLKRSWIKNKGQKGNAGIKKKRRANGRSKN